MIDTSVAIALGTLDPARLPLKALISTVTLAELVSGPMAPGSSRERSFRQRHLQRAVATLTALDFDSHCAHAYGRIYSATRRAGRKPRGGRAVDLLIAATALAHELPLYTLNVADLRGLDGLIEIVDLG